ncbi:hypothetical protein FRC01_010475 [Tulasnella sp. 417]|nr:hypothetical protein FRC01_010475 [Tulasnella sp. 417]
MSDNHVTFGQQHGYMFFQNRAAKEKTTFAVQERALNEKANEDWVVTITVGGAEYTAGPMKTKQAAKDAAAEKAQRGLNWIP